MTNTTTKPEPDKEMLAWASRKVLLSAMELVIWNAYFLTSNNYATKLEKRTVNELAKYLEGFKRRIYRAKPKEQANEQIDQIESSAEFTSDILLIAECVHSAARDEIRFKFENLVKNINEKYLKK